MTHDEASLLYNAGAETMIKILCELSETVEAQQEKIKILEIKIAKLSKNSLNSSKRPSSDDITKPKSNKKEKKGKGKIGGQPGHKKHERPLFSKEEIDETHPYILTTCPDCNGEVNITEGEPRIIQQLELPEKPVIKIEHPAIPA